MSIRSLRSLLLTLAARQGLRHGAFSASLQTLLTNGEFFMSDRNLIKNVLEIENFELAKVLFESLDRKQLLMGKQDYLFKDNLDAIGFFASRKNFNFLTNYFVRKGELKFLRKSLGKIKNLHHVVNLSSKQNFLKLINFIPKDLWLSDTCEPFKEAISSDNLFVVKYIMQIAKDKNLDLKELLLSNNFSYALRGNFNNKKSSKQLLKFLDQETGVVGEALVRSLSDCLYYKNDSSVICGIFRTFKIKEISFSYYTVRNCLHDKRLFFLLYRKTKPEEKHQFFAANEHSLLFELLSRSPMIHPDVTRFLLKNNVRMINENKKSK